MPSAFDATAVFMPITWPDELRSGPPELPELIAASVWRRSVKVSDDEPVSSLAETGRPLPEMIPLDTVFWYWPSALPIAMTCCPTRVVAESPIVAAVRLLTLAILR